MLVAHHRGGPIAEEEQMYPFFALILAGAAAAATSAGADPGAESPGMMFGLAVGFGLTSIYLMLMEIRDTLKK